jgi:peptidyl-prolyl cis-trans isomerase A (cyclophilin A)
VHSRTKRLNRFTLAIIALAFAMLPATWLRAQTPAAPRSAPPVKVIIETSLGEIAVDLDSARAPITVTNFLKYVDAGSYNAGRFHRTVTMQNQAQNPVKIEVVQAGPAQGAARFPAIELERTNVTGLTHKDGVLSMARAGPNTATGDFFICIGNNNSSLDFAGQRNADGQGFAAFGMVTSGMDIVKKIQASPATGPNPQSLTPPITITRIRRVK